VRLFDLRKASSHGSASVAQVHVFSGHTEAINVVQWCPDAPGVFASAGSDGLVNIWDVSRALAAAPPSSASRKPTTALIFQHPGHAGSPVLDFHWSPAEPWTCVSVSENAEAGGSTVQVWRISDMLYRPEHEVLAELEQHKATIAASMKRGKQARNEDDDDDARVEE
jgi:histone-binding protein RBBP4